MSFWQYRVTATYWIAAHETAEGGLSTAEADELWDWLQDKPDTVRRRAAAPDSVRAN